MHAWYVSYCRECNNLESFAAGSPYSTPALQQMSQVYQCCCGQRAEKPAAVMGPPLRARQPWSMRGLWNIHGTMGYATSRLSSHTSSYSYPVPFTLSRWRCSCIPKSAKETDGRASWKAIVFIYHQSGSYSSMGNLRELHTSPKEAANPPPEIPPNLPLQRWKQ